MSKLVTGFLVGIAIVVFSLLAIYVSNGDETIDLSWKSSLYNRELTECLSKYDDIARVYDFDKMRDRTNEQIAEIVGTSVVNVNICR